MKQTTFLILILWSFIAHAQNLVPNANFATNSGCPTSLGELNAAGWSSPFFPGTPDYFNACGANGFGLPSNIAGWQEATTGDAYIGIYTFGFNTREYIQAALTEPTVAGMTYELTLVYSSSDNFGHADGLGMLLSAGAPETATGQVPQLEKTLVMDSQDEWHTLTTEYVSVTGGETHITVGNFYNDANSNFNREGMYQMNAYYYIDSVAVKCMGVPSNNVLADLGGDQEVCATDFPLTLFSNLPAACNEWSTGHTGNWIEVNAPGRYFVKSTLGCEYGTDTIEVRLVTTPTSLLEEEIICAPSAVTIRLDPQLGDYVWNNGSQEAELTFEEDGLYTVALDYGCGTFQDSVSVVIGNNLIDPAWPRLHVLCNDEPLAIDLSSTTADFIVWDDGDTTVTRIFTDEGSRFVRLSDACRDTTFRFSVEREICSSETIYVPNAFSPNGDGINDFLSIGFSQNWTSPRIKFYVFDRWGGAVFFTEDPYFRWDGNAKGKLLDPGVLTYFYELEVEVNGELRTMTESGGVALLR
jgi:gliding motility-associated-like protein